ncbi:adenylate/guanylate cyclase domain-containing protein [Phyllobacterium lublinensis]|uniref:adenylate/guanylate cyclase domain-containing protein n=1 Tax=Phyllobacterium lublinensis TaxID=2875708 RepID=UPI001CCF978C|nr:adenylate/guanylate cyclase domain-containing protein [Phyllobacterium sp. 2063]MBZ9655591.1 adenylate/guanylate cyclase domain-containing protein [Phyllobacterium sp. 2063]
MTTSGQAPVPSENVDSSKWTRSLRTLLSLAMVSLLIAVSLTLAGLDYRRARNAAIEDTKASMRVFADRLVDRFGVLSGDTVTLVEIVASVANSLLSPPPERMDDKIAVLREGMSKSPHIDGAYVGYPDGSFFHVVSLKASGWRIALDAPPEAETAVRSIEVDAAGGKHNNVIFLDAEGAPISERPAKASGYDPRTRPWYKAAVGLKSPVSIGPYEMATTGALGMTIAEAHSANGKVVVGADIVLDTIIDFLTAERMSPDTVAFIVDTSGNPVIHSDRAMMERILSPKDAAEAGLSPSSDPLIRSVLSDDSWVGGAARNIDVDGRTFLVMVAPIKSALLLANHRVVVAAPMDELMAPANRALLQGLGVSAAVVAMAIVCALLLARLITKSLDLLTDGANRLQNLDFSTPIAVPSHVSELSVLGKAMNKARNAIFTFALYVPKELVRKGIQSGQFTGRAAWRQDVTALFTDIYDFTTISERHTPEEVVAMLSEYFDIFNTTVDEHGGTIIQFLGDSVFAMWNAPIPDERHAEHACRCALRTEEKIRAFNEAQRSKGLPEFRTRYGIHTGMAVVGSVGARERLQYTAMGDTVNVASRLEGMNKSYGTTILASAAVKSLCSDAINFRLLGSAQAKGRVEALEIYEVVGEIPSPVSGEVAAQAEIHKRSA